MIKLALLGTLSSHTEQICRRAQESDEVEIVGIFGEDEARTQYLCETYGLQKMEPEEMVEACNAAAILFRDGNKHLMYAEPFLKRQIPLFIDKPFTISVTDAQCILYLSKIYDSPFAAGSCVKFAKPLHELKKKVESQKTLLSGYCCFNLELDSPYGGIHFYSHHLIEEMLLVFGLGVRSITAKRSGQVVTAIAAYDTFHVVMNFGVFYDQYMAGYYSEDGFEMITFDLQEAPKAQFEDMIAFFRTRISSHAPEFFLEAVKISAALEKAMEGNCTVLVD